MIRFFSSSLILPGLVGVAASKALPSEDGSKVGFGDIIGSAGNDIALVIGVKAYPVVLISKLALLTKLEARFLTPLPKPVDD